MIENSVLFQRSTRQVSCKVNDEVAILDLDRALYFGLQGVGVHIWDSLEQPRSVAELCASILAEFDVSEADCRADLQQVLARLQEERLIEVTK